MYYLILFFLLIWITFLIITYLLNQNKKLNKFKYYIKDGALILQKGKNTVVIPNVQEQWKICIPGHLNIFHFSLDFKIPSTFFKIGTKRNLYEFKIDMTYFEALYVNNKFILRKDIDTSSIPASLIQEFTNVFKEKIHQQVDSYTEEQRELRFKERRREEDQRRQELMNKYKNPLFKDSKGNLTIVSTSGGELSKPVVSGKLSIKT